MDDECLSLTWNNHGATYRQTLNTLRKENTLTDVTLACDGQKFSAHKLVLVTCSDYFRTILGDIPCQHPIVYMRGVTAREMQALIDFMYTGRTDIPQKEVPTLLSTAEALQIKGLGVFHSSESQDIGNQTQRDYDNASKRKRCDPERSQAQREYGNASKRKGCDPPTLNGLYEDNSRISTSKSLSREDQFLENLYSHHYALLSSPKQRKTDDKTPVNIPDYMSGGPQTPSGLENSPQKETSSTSVTDPNQNISTSLPPGILNNLLHHRKSDSSKSSLMRASSPMPQSPQDRVANETSSHASDTVKDNITEKDASQSSSSQPSSLNSRPETKAASPRALNYSLAGLGGSKDSPSAGLHGLDAEESSGGHGDTPENLIKTEIKDEALDFSSTTLSENHQGDSSSSALSTNNIGEEARMYLDAFARSANLPWQQTAEDTTQESPAVDGRPFVCPICNKCFAKAAILKRHHLAHFRPYVCHLCPRSFTRREVLAEHMLEHTGADLRMPCPVCGMTIKRKRNLQAHIKVKHPDYYLEKSSKREATC